MNANGRAYLDTSALAKWYLNEAGSEDFVSYLQDLDVAVVSSLTRTEVRSMLARRRRMGELNHELESIVYAAFLNDIAQGWLQLYPVENGRFDEAVNLIARYPEHPLRTLDALHLAIALQAQTVALATADSVMADAATSLGFEVVRFGPG